MTRPTVSFEHLRPIAERRPSDRRRPAGRVSRALALLAVLGAAVTAPWHAIAAETGSAKRPLCLYVSSYHRGYSWSDGVERGLRETLGERCEIVQFDMDTKRQREPELIEAMAAEVADQIERLAPDVVITSDDNAAKYLVVPYLRGGDVPVVFCGVNWTVEEYEFPARNVTGIVEVAPIRPMIREALAIVPNGSRAAYIGALTFTEQKNYRRIADVAETFGVSLDGLFFETLEHWKNAYVVAQSYDFIVMGSYSGIEDWDHEAAARHALEHARRPSLTNHDWMMPVSVIGYTKLPEEHGEYAASAALAILSGTDPLDIPLVTNRKWETWLNPALAARIETPIPERLTLKAKRVSEEP